MSNVTAMSRLKTQLNDFKNALGSDYKAIDLTGKDEQSSRFNDVGYTKAINSDFMRIYKTNKQANMKQAKSFAFAFNNYHKTNSGVIVSIKDGSKQEIAYFTFEEFKLKFKDLVDSLKATEDRCAEAVNKLVSDVFQVTPELCNLDVFFSHLAIKLCDVESKYTVVQNQIKELKNQIDTLKQTMNKTDFKVKKKELQDEIGELYKTIEPLTQEYRDMLTYEKQILVETRPYLSYRLIGLILQPHVAKHKAPHWLKGILETELKATPNYVTRYGIEAND